MKPILFAPNENRFETNGIGRLSDAVSCVVREARNGEFDLELVYPVEGAHFADIVHSAIIWAKPSARRSEQAFRVYKITKPMRGNVTVYCHHLSYQLGFIPVSPFSAAGLATALSGFKTNAAEACPFTLSADFTSDTPYLVPIPTSIRAYLGGKEGSIIDTYGGEWEWDNYNAILHSERGSDNGYIIKYGKNLIDLTQEETIENTYTGVYPYWQSEETMVTLPEKVIHSSTAAGFPFARTVVKDFSSEFQNAPTVAELRRYTQEFIATNDIGIPNVNLSLSWVNLPDIYKDIMTGNVDLCDTVTVVFEKLGVTKKAKIIDYKYDVLNERYTSLQVGDSRSTLATTVLDNIERVSLMPTYAEMSTQIDRATGVLNAGMRGHVVINRNPEGWANEILFLDNENIASARNVLRINMNGIGFSSTGYQGPYYQAWTIDGHLSLGGVNNAYGHLSILNPQGREIGAWSKDGIVVDAGVIDLKRGTNFGLYANGNVIRLGDFEINDDYGRQIITSMDEMTGMGGEPDSSGGLYLWAGYVDEDDYKFVVNDSDAYVMYRGTPYPIGQTLARLSRDI